MDYDSFNVANTSCRAKIPFLLRCQPLQATTIFLFSIGAIIGTVAEHGRVLSDYGFYELKHPGYSSFILILLSCLLFCVSYIIKPIKIRFENKLRSRRTALTVAALYILFALGLMLYNWVRLDAWDLFMDNPGAIAFRLSDEKGMVFLYTTMLCFFIGAAFILDNTKNLFVRYMVALATIVFATGLLGLTRREMLILFAAWGLVYFATQGGKKSILILWLLGIVSVVALYISMLLRGIDIIGDPASYFTSGEFEPFRYALYLIERWTLDPHIVSPWAYAIPFVSEQGPIGSVNGYFTVQMLGDTQWLGHHTVTIFSTLLYFGLIIPLVFYSISVFLLKQSGYWLERQPGFYSSFFYAFFLLKFFIIIRNGELISSLVDTIVLLILAIIFHTIIGWKCIAERTVSA